jgi:chromosomal replication initiator protein
MFLAREMTDASFTEIGEKIGGRDHSTVIYSYNKINSQLKVDRKLIEVIEKIKNIILNKN